MTATLQSTDPDNDRCPCCGVRLRDGNKEITHLRAERDQLLAALQLTMIGGNHLANVLIGRLGGGFATQYPPDLDHEIALQMLGATDEYDMWCCWAAIMTARAAIAAVERRP